MDRQPVVGEFWEITSEQGETRCVFLDKMIRAGFESPFYGRGEDLCFNFDKDCFDTSINCGGEFVLAKQVNRPATKEEIQAWIDKWGVPETFKGQPEYPLEETKQEEKDEYNIPVLVKWFEKRPAHWNSIGKMDSLMGTVVVCRENTDFDSSYQGPKGKFHGDGWYWNAEDVIPNPTLGQIQEEARKAGKSPKSDPAQPTQKPVKLYEPHDNVLSSGEADSTDRFIETGELRLPKKGEWYDEVNGKADMAPWDFISCVSKILKPYTPLTHPVVASITEDLLAKEFAEAKKKVKEAKERATAIREIIRLEEVIKKSTQLKDELTKKWLPEK